jgi:TRAP-type uncharacterized transport system fused permease subunit
MKVDSEYFGKDWTRSKEENVRIFKKRHKLAVWMVFLPLALLLMNFVSEKYYFGYSAKMFVLDIIWILPLLFYMFVIYRCPKCGQTPYSSQNRAQGVLFFPKKCVRCKAPLLPDHPFGQK